METYLKDNTYTNVTKRASHVSYDNKAEISSKD